MERSAIELPTEHLELIRGKAGFGDTVGYLAPEIVELIVEQDWLRLLVPAALGGRELPLPEVVALFEMLARADGNVGWCVNLGAGANMFAGYLEKQAAGEIFDGPRTWCAGSGAVSGKALETDGGYLLSGYWKYASGAAHATHFTANAYLHRPDGTPIFRAGQPVYRSFIVPARQVTVLDTWNVSGLRGSSSRDFELRDVFVLRAHTFSLLQASPFAQGPIYRFPFELLAVVNMSSMQLGMAMHFTDAFLSLAEVKKPLHGGQVLGDYPQLRALLDRQLPAFSKARAAFYTLLDRTWAFYVKGADAPQDLREELRAKSLQAAEAGMVLVRALYPFCGMTGVYEDNPLNKIWRDIHTGGQHFIFSPLNRSV